MILIKAEKKFHSLKVEDCVLFEGLAEDLSLEAASQTALRDCSEEVREEPGYTGLFAAKSS